VSAAQAKRCPRQGLKLGKRPVALGSCARGGNGIPWPPWAFCRAPAIRRMEWITIGEACSAMALQLCRRTNHKGLGSDDAPDYIAAADLVTSIDGNTNLRFKCYTHAKPWIVRARMRYFRRATRGRHALWGLRVAALHLPHMPSCCRMLGVRRLAGAEPT